MSSDLARGFAVVNAGLVLFGIWCYVARVRPGHTSAQAFAWSWTILELMNGTGHIALALSRATYFPGFATAPVLLGVASYLAVKLSAGATRPA